MTQNNCKLSVNINKIATLRNSRGGNTPSVTEAGKRIQGFGAHGITIHPQDQMKDIFVIKMLVI